MKPPDKGLLLSSRVDFTIPSPFARKHLSGGESAASTAQATFPAYSAAVKKMTPSKFHSMNF